MADDFEAWISDGTDRTFGEFTEDRERLEKLAVPLTPAQLQLRDQLLSRLMGNNLPNQRGPALNHFQTQNPLGGLCGVHQFQRQSGGLLGGLLGPLGL